ncbi:MAG: hypothetical protein ACOC33_00175 [bacterium]
MDFGNINSVIDGLKSLFKIQGTSTPNVPAPLLVVGGQNKQGLSPTKIASNIIKRKAEAGLPVGALPSGEVSSDEVLIRIIVEEVVKAIQQDAKITVAIPPGGTIISNGTSPSGPVSTIGSTVTIQSGVGQMQ